MMVGALSMLLGNAVGTSWDLLVRVARIRRRHTESVTPSVRPGGKTQTP